MAALLYLLRHIAPIFIVSSPVTSYSDQIIAIHRSGTAAGFSLDIPLIMLLASIMKVFYWLDARYELSLLLQAVLMIMMQVLLLHAALRHMPTPASQRSRALAAPFADLDPACPAADGKGMDERGGGAAGPEAVTLLASAHSLLRRDGQFVRPYRFWRWRSTRPYWSFLAYFALTLAALQLLLGGGRMPGYAALLGYVALAIEAVLPIPQIRQNQQQRSCRGFRLSVLANWLLGDVMKMVFFFFGTDAGSVPWAFKLCGLFQFVCDVYLGLQYWTYGSKPDAGVEKAAAAAAEATVGSLTSGGEAFRLA